MPVTQRKTNFQRILFSPHPGLAKAEVADANLRVNIWQVSVQLAQIFNLTELLHIE